MTDATGHLTAARSTTSHLIRGWTTLGGNAVAADAVHLRCEEVNRVPADALAAVHAEGRAFPPLDVCGQHDHALNAPLKDEGRTDTSE
ncbi:hypothetical protein ACQP04_09890 [Pseudonocardia halophobica]|uniref:hypothetical protein n=1 Tax=Pseudonocardia halophobica TaxID=29401 RepID=UPI003D9405FE